MKNTAIEKHMTRLNTFKLLEEELGTILQSGMTGESLYYAMEWDELREKAGQAAEEKGDTGPNDVRVADYALDLLGIPNQYVEADEAEDGTWMVYWR